MTTSRTTTEWRYAGNGATTAFDVNERVFDADHLRVSKVVDSTGLEYLQVLNTDYTVSNVGNVNGARVTFTSAPASGWTVVIYIDAPLQQDTSFRALSGRFTPGTHEDALDKLSQQIRALWAHVGRTPRIPLSEAAWTGSLGLKAARLGKLLGFNSVTGEPEMVPPSFSGSGGLGLPMEITDPDDVAAIIVQTAGNEGDETTNWISKDNLLGVPGAQLALTSDTALTEDDLDVTITNTGATALTTHGLPPATVGLLGIFSRVAAYNIRLQPDGGERFREGGADEYLEINRGTIVIECLEAGIWDVVTSSHSRWRLENGYSPLGDYTRAINVVDYGADPTGDTTSGAAFVDAIAAMADGTTLNIPSGEYDLSDLPTNAWNFELSGDTRAVVCMNGVARLKFGGGRGFRLMGNQSNWIFQNLILENTMAGFWSETTGTSTDYLKQNFTFINCHVVDYNGPGYLGYVCGWFIFDRVRYGRWLNCSARNLHSTDGHCIGIYAMPHEDVDLNYEAGDDGTSTGGDGRIVIGDCDFFDLTTDDALADRPLNHGVRVAGHSVTIRNNSFQSIYPTLEDYTTETSDHSSAIYIKAYTFDIEGNHFKDAGGHTYVSIKGEQSTDYGDPATGLIRGNTFTTREVTPNAAMIYCYRSNTKITGNYFTRTIMGNATAYLFRMRTGYGQPNYDRIDGVFIDNNVIREHKGRIAIFGNDNIHFTNNQIIRPYGPTTTATSEEWYGVLFSQVTSAPRDFYDITMTGNRWYFDDNFATNAGAATNGPYWLSCASTPASFYIHNVVIDDQIRGLHLLDSGEAAKLRLLRLGPERVGHRGWRIRFDTDADYGTVAYGIQYTTAAARDLIDAEATVRYRSVLARTSDLSLAEDESGLIVSNEGASGTVTITLPTGAPGQRFTFRRIAAQLFRILPHQTAPQQISDYTAGKYLQMDTRGEVVLRWQGDDASGYWHVESVTATVTPEP